MRPECGQYELEYTESIQCSHPQETSAESSRSLYQEVIGSLDAAISLFLKAVQTQFSLVERWVGPPNPTFAPPTFMPSVLGGDRC